jgi:hypothetical protein
MSKVLKKRLWIYIAIFICAIVTLGIGLNFEFYGFGTIISVLEEQKISLLSKKTYELFVTLSGSTYETSFIWAYALSLLGFCLFMLLLIFMVIELIALFIKKRTEWVIDFRKWKQSKKYKSKKSKSM